METEGWLGITALGCIVKKFLLNNILNSGNLYNELVWYWNAPKLSDHWILHYSGHWVLNWCIAWLIASITNLSFLGHSLSNKLLFQYSDHGLYNKLTGHLNSQKQKVYYSNVFIIQIPTVFGKVHGYYDWLQISYFLLACCLKNIANSLMLILSSRRCPVLGEVSFVPRTLPNC